MTQETEPVGWTIEANKSLALDDSRAEATRILSEAGWIADEGWGSYFHGTCIGGLAPDGNVYVKNIAAIQPGHPKYGPDTPDEFHEAASWLAARYVAKQPEASETPQDETHGETGEEADGAAVGSADNGLGDQQALGSDGGHADEGLHPDAADDILDGADSDLVVEELGGEQPAEPIDADFTLDTIELIEPSEPDFGREQLEWEGELTAEPERAADASGAFIFGDNLDQKRTVAIGLVMQIALSKLPIKVDIARLASLRNYAMGVAEKTLAYNEALQSELDEIEARNRLWNAICECRDTKVGFLSSASRAEIEAFDPSEGWP